MQFVHSTPSKYLRLLTVASPTQLGSQTWTRALGPLENAGGFFFLSSCPAISPSCPCLFRVKTEVHMSTFWLLRRAFREARLTVNRLTYCRLERHHGSFAALGTFHFKHSFLEYVESPLLAFRWNWKCKFPIIINHEAHNTLKGFRPKRVLFYLEIGLHFVFEVYFWWR